MYLELRDATAQADTTTHQFSFGTVICGAGGLQMADVACRYSVTGSVAIVQCYSYLMAVVYIK